MAEASISVNQDQFICAVCLDLLKEPVTIPCGHSYCQVPINDCWNQEDMKSIYSCPQCRETFTPRPVLRRNNMLAEVVKKLKKTELQAASPAHCYAGPGDVDCDSCTERKLKAVKSCLVCLASYCEEHLKPHYQSQAFKKHKLVEACVDLQEKICSQHDKLMEIYCRTDQSFICYLKAMIQFQLLQKEVKNRCTQIFSQLLTLHKLRIKSQEEFQEKQKKVQELKQTVDTIKLRSQAAVDDNEKIFNEMISSLVKRRSEVTEMIRVQEKAELSQAERPIKHLEQEIADLQRRVSDLEQLSHTPDHIHFLQSFPSLCVSPGCDDSPSFTVNQHLSFDGVRKSVSDLKKQNEEICQEEFNKIRPQVCLDLLREPVTIHCGHSFCKVCINSYWNQEDMKSIYSCPQCRETFTPRPVLRRNNMLAEVVEKLKKTKLQAASPAHCYAGPGDVDCDVCIGRKLKAVKSCLKCSQAAVVDNEKIFNEMISSLVKSRSEVTEMIRVQEKADLSRAEQHLKHLVQEITDLQRRVSDLEQLSHTPDQIHFLQSFPSLCVSPECDDSPSFTVNQDLSFDGVRKSVSDLKKRVEEICQEEFNKIRPQDFCYLTLDPNTAHPHLILSEKNRDVTRSDTEQRYSDHPERFDFWEQNRVWREAQEINLPAEPAFVWKILIYHQKLTQRRGAAATIRIF
ncbi:finTRIM family, member 14 [Silurus asotus]|uniref:FinTRIM family, member 14 n=1 Tax=Silurus asotus TaxID=30991 RepID=A0AAD5ACZ2_SILAS|nr:finTRIM family, member 14 [Silurus asotus]